MKRNRWITATAWINAAIVGLGIYVLKMDPEHWVFALIATVASIVWLVIYIDQNAYRIAKGFERKKTLEEIEAEISEEVRKIKMG